ncbi:hypothetical protein [Duganella sp. BJB475]|uniref:hypothetical protein n=1 Tax=Duganella sp. BJB475 TaxID=2233914 RepID=UPI000E3560B5|nr:hypothetical protein [Duganella sp. BJB475]RFP19166.1 hypothetical protein D0T23_05130 [Duganella sp. BJB475]
MSRRFGRNQKRRMRADLAAKESSITSLVGSRAMDQGLMSSQADQISALKDMLQEVREMVGRCAIAAGEPVMSDYAPRVGETSFQKVAFQPPLIYADFSMPDNFSLHVETMRLLDVKAIGDSMRSQMHCRVELNGAEEVYSISDSALNRMSIGELENRLVPEIAKVLSHQLVGQIIAKRRGRFA